MAFLFEILEWLSLSEIGIILFPNFWLGIVSDLTPSFRWILNFVEFILILILILIT